jgi:hypothetical protein
MNYNFPHFQVEVLWFVTPCCVTVQYQCFGEPCCFHLHPEDVGSTVLSYQNTTRRHNSEELDLDLHHLHENLKSHLLIL